MNMKKSRIISLALALALVCGATGATALAVTGDRKDSQNEQSSAAVDPEAPVVKDETVYVIAGTDGGTKKVIVSDRIKNATRSAAEEAVASLENAENVSGDDCWMGSVEKELPVEMKISYRLDGKEISAEELAGKSGRVTIRFDFENRQYRMMDIGGKKEKIYVPFTVLTGALLDNDCFRNVEVTNGKVLTDGGRTAVIGLAFPGLQESLALDSDKLELPRAIEITADVTGFKLDTTLTVVTNSLFNSASENGLDDRTTDGVASLTDAIGKLADGTSELYNGICALLEGAEKLSDGVYQLSGGLNELAAHNNELNAGARQVFDSLLSVANSQLSASGLDVPSLTVENYAEVLDGVLEQLGGIESYAKDAAAEKVRDAVYSQRDYVRSQVELAVRARVEQEVTAGVREYVWAQVLAGAGMTQEQYDAALAAGMITEYQRQMLEAALESELAKAQGVIDAKVAESMASEAVRATIESKTSEKLQQLVNENLSSGNVQSQISSAVAQATAGANSIRALKEQLDSYNSFYTGLRGYTAGVAKASEGASELNERMPEFVEGATRLRDGAMQLSDGLGGMENGDESKLAEALTGDSSIAERVEALKKVSSEYRSFSGLTGDMDGAVRFVYRTEAVKAD